MQPLQLSLAGLEPVGPLRVPHRQRPTLRLTQPLGGLQHLPKVLSSSTIYNSQHYPWSPIFPSAGLKIDTKMDMESQAVPLSARSFRPLPAIPSPSSATQFSPRSPRPLPSPPCISPMSATSFQPIVNASLTVSSTPKLLEPSIDTQCPALSAPIIIRGEPSIPVTAAPIPSTPNERNVDAQHFPPPSRPKLPTLVTCLDSLKPPDVDIVTLSSPLSPQPPTPQTAKRKRMAKLRRRLGESLLDEAVNVYPRESPTITITSPIKSRSAEEESRIGDRMSYIRAAIDVGNILAIESESDENSDEERDAKQSIREDYSWVLENGTVYRGPAGKRHSKKWMFDKGGRRWEEPDYKVILQALRSI